MNFKKVCDFVEFSDLVVKRCPVVRVNKGKKEDDSERRKLVGGGSAVERILGAKARKLWIGVKTKMSPVARRALRQRTLVGGGQRLAERSPMAAW